jgi:hypothetical protein
MGFKGLTRTMEEGDKQGKEETYREKERKKKGSKKTRYIERKETKKTESKQ